MNQVKYIAYACLIAIASAGAFSFLSLLSGEEPQTNVAQVSTIEGSGMAADMPPSKGASLFRTNCGTCHAANKVLSGPALAGVMSRGPWAEDEKNIYQWIKNPGAFIPTTPYTQALQKQYGQVMPSFGSLKEEELKEIVDYLKTL